MIARSPSRSARTYSALDRWLPSLNRSGSADRPKTSYYALDAAEQSRNQIQPLPYTSATTSVWSPFTDATSTCCTSVYSFSDASSSSLRFRDSRTRTR